jgi:hypothetical protein
MSINVMKRRLPCEAPGASRSVALLPPFVAAVCCRRLLPPLPPLPRNVGYSCALPRAATGAA